PIEHVAAVAAHVDEAHLKQDAQVLRNRGLLHPNPIHDLTYGPLLEREIVEDLPPPRLRHRIERIRSCRRSCHGRYITFPYRHMSSIFFSSPFRSVLLVRRCPTVSGR